MTTAIKQNDIGIRINVTHTAAGTVYYAFNGGPETALTDNDYLVLSAIHTAKRGINHITFIEKTGTTRITSDDVFEFEVV